jgi:hypothetical protein
VSQISFLLDEHVPASVGDAIVALEPAILFRQVGAHPDVPPKGTLDPDVLLFAERAGFTLVTFDKRTMRRHVEAHLVGGHHTWGVFVFPNGRSLSAGRVAEELLMFWTASQAEEWMDQIEFLPY